MLFPTALGPDVSHVLTNQDEQQGADLGNGDGRGVGFGAGFCVDFGVGFGAGCGVGFGAGVGFGVWLRLGLCLDTRRHMHARTTSLFAEDSCRTHNA